MEYYIDLGSSTIKVYGYEFTYFKELKERYQLLYYNTNIYVTGIFRNLSYERKTELIKEFNDRFDLHFHIISHGIENYYLAKAMENDYNNKKVLIINMGGKTTELVTFQNNKVIRTDNLTIGVADMLNQFDKVNEPVSGNTIEEMDAFVSEKLESLTLDTDYDCAIFTGGEERFELLTGFHLVENTLFHDSIHRYMVSLEDYIKGTEKVFYEMTLEELYALMPQNPKWMDGARAGAIIPLTLFKKANVPYVIPSDLNLINGVINDQ